MKRLLIIRHSKTESERSDDFNRKLVEEGFRRCHAQGELLSKLGIKFRIIHSAAVRTTETALLLEDYISDGTRLEPEVNLYGADLSYLVEYISNFDENMDNIAIIGHNPTMHYAAEYFTDLSLEGFPTASAVLINLENGDWKQFAKGKKKNTSISYSFFLSR